MQAKAKFDVIMNCNVILFILYVYWATPLLELLWPLYLYICSYSKNDIKLNSIRFLITDRTSLLFPVKLLYLTWLPHHVKLKIKQKVSTPEYKRKTQCLTFMMYFLYYVMQRLLDSKNLIIESQSLQISYRLGKCELMKWWYMYPSFFSDLCVIWSNKI